jgi:hypothetical protein
MASSMAAGEMALASYLQVQDGGLAGCFRGLERRGDIRRLLSGDVDAGPRRWWRRARA